MRGHRPNAPQQQHRTSGDGIGELDELDGLIGDLDEACTSFAPRHATRGGGNAEAPARQRGRERPLSIDEAKTTWAVQEPATSYRQPQYAQPQYAQPPHAQWPADEATGYWQERHRTHYPQHAQPQYAQPQHEEATSYWRGQQQAPQQQAPQQPVRTSPRAETFLSAASGGVGRPAAFVAAASAQAQLESRGGRRPAQPMPASRAPSRLPDEEGWSVEERTRLKTEARNEAKTEAPTRAHRDASQARRAPHAPQPAQRDDARNSRAVAGELSARSGHSQAAPRPITASGSGPRQLPAYEEPHSMSLSRSMSVSMSRSIIEAGIEAGIESGNRTSAAPAPSAASPSPSPSPAPGTPAGPLRIEAPPEVAMAAYPLVRRIALQQDLKAADRVLRVGLAELTNATTCRTWYIGVDGERFSLELNGEATAAEQALLDQSLAALQPRASGRLLVVPVIATGKVVALALLGRTDQLPTFAPAELMVAMVVTQETAGFVVQLLMHHAEGQRDAAADAKSIYNAEALASQRKRGHEGGLIHLSPRWVRIAYPAAVISVLVAIIFAIIAKVPTYSAGAGVITIAGIEITSPSPGSVASVRVSPGQPVRAGEELARLLSQDEESALAQADREYRNALATLLFDGADEVTKAAAATAATARQRAVDRLEARVIRAPEDGVVGDVRVRGGAALALGDHVLTLLKQGAEPTALVFLPGQDRPRLRKGQAIQIELSGYTKVREKATILEVGAEVIGPNEARRALGQKNADAVPLNGPVVMVRAKLPTRTFKVSRDTFRYHDGMPLRGEVKVENKPFLISLIPALEKAL